MKKVLLLVPFIALASVLQGQDLPRFFSPGEVLRYKVQWKFLRLGTITVRSTSEPSRPGEKFMRGCIEVESNPDIPFIHIEEINESLIDLTTMHSIDYSARHVSGEEVTLIRCTYEDSIRSAQYEVRDGLTGRLVSHQTIPDVQGYIEGTALFFYTRYAASLKGTRSIPTFAQGSIKPTTLEFSPVEEEVEIECWDHPIRTTKYSGYAAWTGASAAGVTGEFEGWVSDDTAAIPVCAELKILLGSIHIELESWSRPGWSPPSSRPPISTK